MIINAGVRETSKNGTVLLWENEATNVGAMKLTLDLSPYKVLYITLQNPSGETLARTTLMILNDATMTSQCLYCVDQNSETGRYVTVTSTGLSFTAGFERAYNSDGTITFKSNLANVAVPIRIYGSY